MDQKGKRPARDLSDLKARLGIGKTEGQGTRSGVQPAVPGPAATGPGLPVVPPVTSTGNPVVAPPGVTGPGLPMVPPGTSPIHPAIAPAPAAEPNRDPYATARAPVAAAAVAAPIVDAGPQLAIPEQKKSRLSLIVAVVVVALVALVAGHMFGRISHARVLYNKTLDDADRIRGHVQKMADFDARVVVALTSSSKRNNGRIEYDETLVSELRALEQSPEASPEGRKRLENALFRTNYAMMEDLLINRLFGYYTNTVRLMSAIRAFVNHAEQQKAEIQQFKQAAGNAERNFGVVVAEAKGSFYLGNLVELGRWVCPDQRARAAGKCKGKDVTGFEVRPPGGTRWSERPGSKKGGGPLGIVVPITPDKSWKSVATVRRGYLDFGLYVQRYRSILRVSALLAKERKDLIASLKKQASHPRLFTL